MTIYLSAYKLPKQQFVGTLAWYFFIVNLSKLPVFIGLSIANPAKSLVTVASIGLNLALFPGILIGVYLGRWLLPRIPQRGFEAVVLILAGLAAIKLALG